MLASSSTRFPVYVDPAWEPVTESSPAFTYVQQAYPTTSHWNEAGAQLGVGFQGLQSTTGIERAYYQFNVGKDVTTGDVLSATLNATEVFSSDWSCTNLYTVDLTNVDHISSATTWNAQPARFSDNNTSAKVGGANANGGCVTSVPFTEDVTKAVADDGDGTLTVMLTVMLHMDSETNTNAFKRTSANPTVSVTYFPTPHDQGNIPWATYGPVQLDDSLVASPNLSNGDLVLNATDLNEAAVGQSLQLTGPGAEAGASEDLTKLAAKYGACMLSFNPKTPVLLGNGTTKPIGKIQPGDKVESGNLETGKNQGGHTVTATLINLDLA
ncbi:hypothetical protein GA0115240_134720 [Streptomyces sp. DvalAA-14]|uniref:DNRLRE domain-containing protein n=1 Tax=unclassified Streptomyces TaxID=2593676 RepID=UPI00081B593F|nr:MULTISPECIES: DNRLRE domain-containing protein [unclassified Streptomyces]MYS21719.1 DNRLRE domain-containing protein [Streptomyces sp. SID4948]SCD99574.1 hypothetical protein GA0115240_134720 [Streptomyces sp. DvalAA-14]